MFSGVNQRNLRITPAPLNLTKYAQKTLCTKTPLSWGVTSKTFHDTEIKKKNNKLKKKANAFSNWIAYGNPIKIKPTNETQIPTGFGNPVITLRYDLHALKCMKEAVSSTYIRKSPKYLQNKTGNIIVKYIFLHISCTGISSTPFDSTL